MFRLLRRFYLYIGITSLYKKNSINLSGLQDGMLHKNREVFLCDLQIYACDGHLWVDTENGL